MAASQGTVSPSVNDDVPTVCAISMVAAMLTNVLHEGVGHAATALLTGTPSGVLSTVAWISAFDTRLVAAGGTLVNLAAGLLFWAALRAATAAPVRLRFFLFAGLAFNLFTATGYFFFSGVTNFGDWAIVIEGTRHHGLWRALLLIGGMSAYYGAVVLVGWCLVRYVGVPLAETRRFWKLTGFPYLSATLLLAAGGLLNPVGLQLAWQSALPGAAGADCGLLWMRYYIPKRTVPTARPEGIRRSYVWMAVALALALLFVFVLGRGIPLHR